ncbi:MAG TPA: CvpA family protein [Verrucomicrobiae bacterium]|nr:CvpA family protein [Verrucomicrobiae bacterium]
MIASSIQSMASIGLPFNWFDVAVIVILAFGLFRGRKNGMSREMLPALQWLAVVLVCGLGYSLVAQLFRNATSLDQLTSDVLAYLLLAAVVWVLTSIPKHKFSDRLALSNFFGGGEFYLGMLVGMIRFACILLAALALLNAPFYSEQEILKRDSYDKTNYGGGLYQGSYFPHIYTIQDAVFMKSFIGPCIKKYLGPLLINTTQPDAKKSSAPQTQPVIHIGN